MSEREGRGTKSKATAATLLVVTALSIPAQAQQDVLTLACKGTPTSTEGEKPTPVSKGLIVNLTARTIQGFNDLLFREPPDEITGFNDTTIQFFSRRELGGIVMTFMGSIDRVTGDLEATWTVSAENQPNRSGKYLLNCRPAQRLF